MSAMRSFRTVVRNSSQFVLRQTFNHLCNGMWTPGGWTPPGSIARGTSGGMQGESDGFPSATTGYAKYDVIREVNNSKQGMIYLYWSNPYYGFTNFRYTAAPLDVYPDCDF